MNMFAALETPLQDLPWHCDCRDKDPRDEGARQLATLTRARIICPAVDIVAIPNVVFYENPTRGQSFVRFAFCKRDEVLIEASARLERLSG